MVENALVIIAIIVGLAITDILMSLHRLLRAREQVRWDWLPLALCLLVLLTLLQAWWGLAGARAPSVTLGAFLPWMMTVVLLFLLAAAVLPDKVPAEGVDLRAYYESNAGYIWTLFTLGLGLTTLINIADRMKAGASLPAASLQLSVDLLITLLFASAILVRRRWWHAIVVLALSSGPLVWLSRSLS